MIKIPEDRPDGNDLDITIFNSEDKLDDFGMTDFTWKCTNVTERHLDIELYFKNPLDISQKT